MDVTAYDTYKDFASDVVATAIRCLPQNLTNITALSLRIINRSWESLNGIIPYRVLFDVTYKEGNSERVVTTDMQYPYQEYISGNCTRPDAFQRIYKEVEIAITSDRLNQEFMKRDLPLTIPKDASVLPICLDNGESLKEYHKKIGFKLPEGYHYGPTCIEKDNPETSLKVTVVDEHNQESNSEFDDYEEDRSC